jgi:hypothetical protein
MAEVDSQKQPLFAALVEAAASASSANVQPWTMVVEADTSTASATIQAAASASVYTNDRKRPTDTRLSEREVGAQAERDTDDKMINGSAVAAAAAITPRQELSFVVFAVMTQKSLEEDLSALKLSQQQPRFKPDMVNYVTFYKKGDDASVQFMGRRFYTEILPVLKAMTAPGLLIFSQPVDAEEAYEPARFEFCSLEEFLTTFHPEHAVVKQLEELIMAYQGFNHSVVVMAPHKHCTIFYTLKFSED